MAKGNIDIINKIFESKVGRNLSIQDLAEVKTYLGDIVNEFDRLKTDLKQAKTENEVQEKFYKSVVHDIRTPTQATVGFSEALMDETDPDVIQEGLKTINYAGNKIKNLAETIISYNNVLAGKELNKEEFILKECLESIYDGNKIIVANKGLEFNLDYNPIQSIVMNTDKQLFERVFDNLISNAVKFTPEGHIELGVYEVLGGGLKFSVEDTGTGIAPEYLEKVFDMNTQVKQSDTKDGMGYGLSIVKDFVSAMGGQIKVDSQVNEGSTFSVLMPTSTYKKL